MTEHQLTALHGSSPLGFLAGLGAVAAALRRRELGEVRLAWGIQPPHHARLWSAAADPDGLAQAVFKGLTDRSTLTPESVTGTKSFKELTLAGCRAQFDKLDADEAALLAAMVSDVTTRETPLRGPLVMTGGPQDFTGEVSKLRAEVREAGTASIANALFGPWQYVDGHPLGFDPLMERQHAYLGSKPERDSRRVPGAVLLATTALAFLPLFPADCRGGVSNVLFPDRGWEVMSWPLWEDALPLAGVASVLGCAGRAAAAAALPAGVFALFGAERKEVKTAGGSYPVLRPGRRLR